MQTLQVAAAESQLEMLKATTMQMRTTLDDAFTQHLGARQRIESMKQSIQDLQGKSCAVS